MLHRALALFTTAQQELLQAEVLKNLAVHAWAHAVTQETGQHVDPNITRGRLLACLDVLATHWKSELDNELSRGVRLPV